MTPARIQTLFSDYARASLDSDVERMASFWAFPAVVIHKDRQVALDPQAFHKNFGDHCRFYEAQGVANAEKELIDLVTLNDTTTAVRTKDWLFDTHGMVIAEWESAYLLNESAGEPKISAAMPAGEIEMWKSRGTPLPPI
jgi:hypothetical protein